MVNKILNQDKNSVWIMYNSENCDPYFSKFITNKTIVPALCIISNNNKFLIAHALDVENLHDFKGEVLTYDGENALIQIMTDILNKLKYPQVIYLNYSDKLDSQTDVLGYGTYRFITDNIIAEYKQKNIKLPNFKSADTFIYKLLDSKSDEDIFYFKLAANRALEIINTAFKKIKVGMTEKQILNLVHNISSFKSKNLKRYNIIEENFSWEKELCPIVLVGANLKKGGHSEASNQMLQFGDTVYMDFGIQIHLKDGRKYSSDLQRMGYALKPKEFTAPPEIKNVFSTLYEAIDIGIKNCKPGVKGHEIDKLVRDYITKKGYPSYNHATGHPVGETAHSPGTSISPKGHKRSGLPLQENGVYTIEPRIQIKNGGSIEEMVRITKNGGITLCERQKSLYLIRY